MMHSRSGRERERERERGGGDRLKMLNIYSFLALFLFTFWETDELSLFQSLRIVVLSTVYLVHICSQTSRIIKCMFKVPPYHFPSSKCVTA